MYSDEEEVSVRGKVQWIPRCLMKCLGISPHSFSGQRKLKRVDFSGLLKWFVTSQSQHSTNVIFIKITDREPQSWAPIGCQPTNSAHWPCPILKLLQHWLDTEYKRLSKYNTHFSQNTPTNLTTPKTLRTCSSLYHTMVQCHACSLALPFFTTPSPATSHSYTFIHAVMLLVMHLHASCHPFTFNISHSQHF